MDAMKGARVSTELCDEIRVAVLAGESSLRDLLNAHRQAPYFQDMLGKAEVIIAMNKVMNNAFEPQPCREAVSAARSGMQDETS